MNAHEEAAVVRMREGVRGVDVAIVAAERGDDDVAAKIARRARDHLYFAEIDLRRGSVLRLTGRRAQKETG